MGQWGDDLSSRLQQLILTPTSTISITMTDTALAGGSATVMHTVTAADSLYQILSDLNNQINAVNPSVVGSYFSGNQVVIFSGTGNTTYSVATSAGAAEAIAAAAVNATQETVTVSSNLARTITWYDFATLSDYLASSSTNGGRSRCQDTRSRNIWD